MIYHLFRDRMWIDELLEPDKEDKHMAKYKKACSGKNITVFASVGILVGSGAVGCGGNASKQQDLVITEIASGRLNLDAVKDAFETSKDISEFEKQVNEIYEGDNLVLIRVEDNESQKIISGFEDLNQSNAIEEANDDKLFSITLEEKRYEVYGYGYNHYYHYGSDYGDDDNYYYYDNNRLYKHWLGYERNKDRGRLTYQTKQERAAQMRRDRDRFRSSSGYAAQRSANNAFFSRQKARNPQAFSSRPQNLSRQRSAYRQKQMSRIGASRTAASPGGIRGGS